MGLGHVERKESGVFGFAFARTKVAYQEGIKQNENINQ